MEKPRSIKVFDVMFAAGMLLSIGSLLITWNESMDVLRSDPATARYAPVVMIVSVIIGYGLNLLLWLFISRRRSNVARWIFTLFTGYAVGSALLDQTAYAPDLGADLIYWSACLLCIVQVVCLFLPDSGPWFRGRPDDHISIRDTFG